MLTAGGYTHGEIAEASGYSVMTVKRVSRDLEKPPKPKLWEEMGLSKNKYKKLSEEDRVRAKRKRLIRVMSEAGFKRDYIMSVTGFSQTTISAVLNGGAALPPVSPDSKVRKPSAETVRRNRLIGFMLTEGGFTYADIAKSAGCSLSTVSRAARDIPNKPARCYSKDGKQAGELKRKKLIAVMFRAGGYTYGEIAEAAGYSLSTVRAVTQSIGKNARQSFLAELLREGGRNYGEIAELTGYTPRAVRYAARELELKSEKTR